MAITRETAQDQGGTLAEDEKGSEVIPWSDWIFQYFPSDVGIPDHKHLMKEEPLNKVLWRYSFLKSLLSNQPILRLPGHYHSFILRNDGSDIGIGAVLLQEWEGELSPLTVVERSCPVAKVGIQ